MDDSLVSWVYKILSITDRHAMRAFRYVLTKERVSKSNRDCCQTILCQTTSVSSTFPNVTSAISIAFLHILFYDIKFLQTLSQMSPRNPCSTYVVLRTHFKTHNNECPASFIQIRRKFYLVCRHSLNL